MVADHCDREHKGRALLAYAAARALLDAQVAPLSRPAESVALEEALGRVLAESVRLDRDEPPVPRSAMDGFALRSADGSRPRRVIQSVFAGTAKVRALGPDEAAAVMTGGTVPPGADCVVPVERTRAAADRIEPLDPPRAGAHVRQMGEMGRAGRAVLSAGRRLAPGDLAVAASSGADPLLVRSRPRVRVLSTGDEVVPWNAPVAPHQVRDSNRLAAVARMRMLGADMLGHAHAPDEPDRLASALGAALEDADLTITVGGVSMGEKDYLPTVLERLGVREVLHGVAIQPGKPVWIGRRGERWVLGLPGNPVSSFVILELFGRALLDGLHGIQPRPACDALLPGVAGAPLRAKGRELWLPAAVRARSEGPPELHALPWTGSGDWTCLVGADALIQLAPGTHLESGAPLRYLPL